MRSAFLVGVALLASLSAALAHSWYPWECCSDQDCWPLSFAEVEVTPKGFRLPTGETLSFDDPKIKPTPADDPEQRYHICTVGGDLKGRVLCLFVPQGGRMKLAADPMWSGRAVGGPYDGKTLSTAKGPVIGIPDRLFGEQKRVHGVYLHQEMGDGAFWIYQRDGE